MRREITYCTITLLKAYNTIEFKAHKTRDTLVYPGKVQILVIYILTLNDV